MTLTLRTATVDDAAAIAAIHIRTWQVAYRDLMPASFLAGMALERRTEQWRRSLATGFPAVLLALAGDTVAGWIAYGPSRDPDKAGQAAEIVALYVLPTFWQQGVGRRLSEAAMHSLGDAGHTDVTLWVLSANDRARRFYEKIGFSWDQSSKTIQIGETPLVELRYQYTLPA